MKVFSASGKEGIAAGCCRAARQVTMRAMADVTLILEQLARGDPLATDKLLPVVYGELRQLAARALAGERSGQTLDATALVHEAYLRLVGPEVKWDHRGHFFAAAATAMRRILVDRARRRRRLRHGGHLQRAPMPTDVADRLPDAHDDLLALDDALRRLADVDAVKARLVELRYFAGLTGDQAAALLGISPSAADRHWTFTRAWLRREIEKLQTSME